LIEQRAGNKSTFPRGIARDTKSLPQEGVVREWLEAGDYGLGAREEQEAESRRKKVESRNQKAVGAFLLSAFCFVLSPFSLYPLSLQE
jgi:hypothetical protein